MSAKSAFSNKFRKILPMTTGFSTKNLIISLSFTIILLSSCNDPIDFYLVDGSPHRLHEYRGKWLIVNFWAEWCAPCRQEVPELNQLFENAMTNEISIIGISYDPLSNGEIIAIMNTWGMKYPVMASKPNPILPFALPKSLPGNYIINPDGELVYKLSGTQTAESISKLLKTLQNKER